MDDIPPLHSLVLTPKPGIDPKGLGPHDFLLFIGHRTRDIHHVNDGGVRLRLRGCRPGSIPSVLSDRDNHRIFGVVTARGDLTPEGLHIGAAKMSQRLWASRADAVVLVPIL